jgi:hypothetical protein
MKKMKVTGLLTVLSLSYFCTSSFGDPLKNENFFLSTYHKITPVKISPATKQWIETPPTSDDDGVKAQIYTDYAASEYLTLETQPDKKLVLKSCECGPDNCYPVLPPMYEFTIEELTRGTTTFKGISGALIPIAAGGSLLAVSAVDFGPLGALSGLFGFIGGALNPQAKGQQFAQESLETRQLVQSAGKDLKLVKLEVGGKFEDMKASYINFLKGIKHSEGTKADQLVFKADESQWHDDMLKKKVPDMKTCQSEILSNAQAGVQGINELKDENRGIRDEIGSLRDEVKQMREEQNQQKTVEPSTSGNFSQSNSATSATEPYFLTPN